MIWRRICERCLWHGLPYHDLHFNWLGSPGQTDCFRRLKPIFAIYLGIGTIATFQVAYAALVIGLPLLVNRNRLNDVCSTAFSH